jgi:hypothetical protein
MDVNEIYSKLLENSKPTVGRWRSENRLIIQFLDSYFTPAEIFEFVSNRNVTKLDNLLYFGDLTIYIINQNEDILINFIYAYGEEFMGLLRKKSDFENNKKFKLFFEEYYSLSTFSYYFDFLIKSNFKYIYDDLIRFKDDYDDFIYDFFVNFQKEFMKRG